MLTRPVRGDLPGTARTTRTALVVDVDDPAAGGEGNAQGRMAETRRAVQQRRLGFATDGDGCKVARLDFASGTPDVADPGMPPLPARTFQHRR